MEDRRAGEYLAECFWPGVTDGDLASIDTRAHAAAQELSRLGEEIRYLGSLLMAKDEVFFCRFEGSEDSARRAARRAAIPYERIMKATRSKPYSTTSTDMNRTEPID